MSGWLAIAGGFLKAVGAFFGWREKAAEKDLRDMDREAGRNEQKVADLEGQKAQAGMANAIDEDVRRMSDSELDDSLPVRNKPKTDAR